MRCTACGYPLLQMSRQDAEELPWGNCPDSLKLLGEVARVARNDVLRTSFQSALQNLVVVGVRGYMEVFSGVNKLGFLPNRPNGSGDLAGVKGKSRPPQHSLVFFKKVFRNDERELFRKRQFQ